jgi:hypothetical protein
MDSAWIHWITALLETREQGANTCGTQEGQAINRGIRLSVLGLSVAMGLAVALIVGWATPAWAPTCWGCSQLMIPLEGDWSFGDDLVNLQGRIHLVYHVIISSASTQADVHANLADVLGAGLPSGDMCLATGADQMSVETSPGPVSSLSFTARFELRPAFRCTPPNPCPSTGLPVRISLQFQEDGNLTDARAVVGGGTD